MIEFTTVSRSVSAEPLQPEHNPDLITEASFTLACLGLVARLPWDCGRSHNAGTVIAEDFYRL